MPLILSACFDGESSRVPIDRSSRLNGATHEVPIAIMEIRIFIVVVAGLCVGIWP